MWISGSLYNHVQSDALWEWPGICILNLYMNDLDACVGLGITRAELPPRKALGGVGGPPERTEGCVSV